MKTETLHIYRSRDPFDDSAVERLRRMGLLTAEGEANVSAMAVFSRLYAGLFYDDLLDFHCGMGEVQFVCERLIERSENDSSRQMMLALCVEYDAMRRSLPEPVWWIAGSTTLLAPFIDGFVSRLGELARESEAVGYK